MRHARRSAAVVFTVTLAVLAFFPSTATARPTPVSECQTLGAPGAYALAADIAVVDTTCIEITASNVTRNLAGHTLSCTGSGFAGSCQVPEFTSRGVSVAPELTGIPLKGPGTITGFDNGVVITGSNAHVKELTIAGPPCDPIDCPRPLGNGILVLGGSGASVSANSVRGYLYGLRLIDVRCRGADPRCVFNGNTVRDNTHWGILADNSTGYTITRNVVAVNGTTAFFKAFHAGGIAMGTGGDGITIVGNTVSNNVGWGIGLAPAANGNTIINNTARGNQAGGVRSGIGDFQAADLMAFPGSSNTWNDSNRCHTEAGVVQPTVSNPGE